MRTSYLNDWNADLLDEYYQRWKQDPDSVDSSWSAFFEGFELGLSPGKNGQSAAPETGASEQLLERVDGLIYNFRILGHTQARIDPLSDSRPEQPALSLRELGLEDVPLDTVVSSRYFQKSRRLLLGELMEDLQVEK